MPSGSMLHQAPEKGGHVVGLNPFFINEITSSIDGVQQEGHNREEIIRDTVVEGEEIT